MHALNFNHKLQVLNAKQMLVLWQLPKVNIPLDVILCWMLYFERSCSAVVSWKSYVSILLAAARISTLLKHKAQRRGAGNLIINCEMLCFKSDQIVLYCKMLKSYQIALLCPFPRYSIYSSYSKLEALKLTGWSIFGLPVSFNSRFGRKDATSATGDLDSVLVTHQTRYLHMQVLLIGAFMNKSHQVV